MAAATYSVTTSSSGVNKLWRKVQGDIADGFGFDVPEYDFVEMLKDYKIDVSAREFTVPVDITEGAGIADIEEGGDEAMPYTPNLEELTLGYQTMNGRFTASVTAQILDRNHRRAELRRQIVYQGAKKIQDLARHWGDYFYGFREGYLAQTSTNATQASGTYTLLNAYGQSTMNNAALVADKFKVNDRVALIRAGALVTNAIGTVTAVSASTPSIDVTWNGSVDSDANDYVVKANSLENTTIAGTSYNKGMTGITDACVTASVHGLSSASVANWSNSYANTTAERFNGITFRRMKQSIEFYGGGKLDRLILAPGVYRDVVSLQSAALRFDDPWMLELDADLKTKGVKLLQTKRVPNGWGYGFDSRHFRKLDVMPRVDSGFSWEDGHRMENKNAYVFPITYLTGLVVTNRKCLTYVSQKTEQ